MMASVRPLARTNNETTNVIASSGADHARFIRERSAELVALAMLPDASAHQTIISELKNPDKEIRQTALEALKQVTDRSIVPQMQAVADQTDDPNEKQAILDAIEYINLPSLTEYLHKTSNSAGNSPPPQTSPTK